VRSGALAWLHKVWGFRMPMLSSVALRRALISGLGAACLATTAQAAVRYEFRWFTDDAETTELGSFTYVSPDFITGQRVVDPADLAACATGIIASTCASQTLDEDSEAYGETGYDVVVFGYDQRASSRVKPAYHFFADGALTTPGAYDQIVSDHISRLTVTVVPEGVPEPATWALMLGGFGLAGAVLRRRRGAAAA